MYREQHGCVSVSPYEELQYPGVAQPSDMWQEISQCLDNYDATVEANLPSSSMQRAGSDATSPEIGPEFDVSAGYAAVGNQPHIRIVEQPASNSYKFRYEIEARSAGSIPGASSTPDRKTFPAIEVCGLTRRTKVRVIVSCVTKDSPYRPHPHNLVGRDCSKGVCCKEVELNPPHVTPTVTFPNVGVQCVRKKDVARSLERRRNFGVAVVKGLDPSFQQDNIDLKAVRLCFQAFLLSELDAEPVALRPVLSDVIYNKHSVGVLAITRLSHCAAPVTGGQKVVLLCEKVAREDIAVTFFEKTGERLVWSAEAQDLYVHKQVAIVFTTPRYRNLQATEHVQVFLELRRPTDGAASKPVPFELLPSQGMLRRKRLKPIADFGQYDQQRKKAPPLKLESPPFQQLYPPLQQPPPQDLNWNIPPSTLHIPGPSEINTYTVTDMQSTQRIQQSPCEISSELCASLSPITEVMTHIGQVSTNFGHVSTNIGQLSNQTSYADDEPSWLENGNAIADLIMEHGQASTDVQFLHMSQLPPKISMEATTTADDSSIRNLLTLDRGSIPVLNSSDFSGLSGLLTDGDMDPDALSDSLSKLTTGGDTFLYN